jgi:ABC-2 type transport system ATP-binding protein
VETSIIELRGLTKKYGTFTAVNQLNLSISKGEVFGLLGPNGAGKSTTILMMLGLSEPTAGQVKVCGIDATHDPIAVKRRVGYMPDDIGFYQNYTGLENLLYTAELNGLTDNLAITRVENILEKVGLAAEAHKKVGKYSRGMRQRLGLADVLIKNPEVIILDEPTLGIDPQGVREFLDLIVQLSREEGITVLLSSHHLHQVQQVCDRVGLFVGGQLLAEGNIAQLSAKLFPDEAFTISVKVKFASDQTPELEKQRLLKIIQSVNGVLNIQVHDDLVQIGCATDVTDTIAKTIIESGFALIHLHQKEYGLDDIYHRYFEGRGNDAKAN